MGIYTDKEICYKPVAGEGGLTASEAGILQARMDLMYDGLDLRLSSRAYITDKRYGSKRAGDDVYSAVQDAIDDLAGRGGGLVVLPEGEWGFSNLVEGMDNVGLMGCGALTRIVPSGNYPLIQTGEAIGLTTPTGGFFPLLSNCIVDLSSNANDVDVIKTLHHVRGIGVANLLFIGNPAQSQHGIHCMVNNTRGIYSSRFHNIRCYNMAGEHGGLWVEYEENVDNTGAMLNCMFDMWHFYGTWKMFATVDNAEGCLFRHWNSGGLGVGVHTDPIKKDGSGGLYPFWKFGRLGLGTQMARNELHLNWHEGGASEVILFMTNPNAVTKPAAEAYNNRAFTGEDQIWDLNNTYYFETIEYVSPTEIKVAGNKPYFPAGVVLLIKSPTDWMAQYIVGYSYDGGSDKTTVTIADVSVSDLEGAFDATVTNIAPVYDRLNPFKSRKIMTNGPSRRGRFTESVLWNPASLIDGAYEDKEVTVTGARPGDTVRAGLSSIAAAGWNLVGAVTADDTVTVRLTNNTGGEVNLDSGSLNLIVERP